MKKSIGIAMLLIALGCMYFLLDNLGNYVQNFSVAALNKNLLASNALIWMGMSKN